MVVVSYFVHGDTLLQIAKYVIAKCDSYFITICEKSYLQNMPTFYNKMQQFYYKMRQLLQAILVQAILN